MNTFSSSSGVIGDELNGVSYSDPATVKKDAIRAGDICELDRATFQSDGFFFVAV